MKDLGLFVEDNVEVPASAERADGGFDAEALSGYDLDLDWTVGALRIGDGDTGSVELLVRWVDHFVLGGELVVEWWVSGNCTYLFREVDPEL